MGKLAIWILVALAALLIFRLLSQGKGRTRHDDGGAAGPTDADGPKAGRRESGAAGEGSRNELIMACSVCGVHVPASEALYARGQVYCSEAHRERGASSGS